MTRNLSLSALALVLAGTAGFADSYHPDHAVVDANYQSATEVVQSAATRNAESDLAAKTAGSNLRNGGGEVQHSYSSQTPVTEPVSGAELH